MAYDTCKRLQIKKSDLDAIATTAFSIAHAKEQMQMLISSINLQEYASYCAPLAGALPVSHHLQVLYPNLESAGASSRGRMTEFPSSSVSKCFLWVP